MHLQNGQQISTEIDVLHGITTAEHQFLERLKYGPIGPYQARSWNYDHITTGCRAESPQRSLGDATPVVDLEKKEFFSGSTTIGAS